MGTSSVTCGDGSPPPAGGPGAGIAGRGSTGGRPGGGAAGRDGRGATADGRSRGAIAVRSDRAGPGATSPPTPPRRSPGCSGGSGRRADSSARRVEPVAAPGTAEVGRAELGRADVGRAELDVIQGSLVSSVAGPSSASVSRARNHSAPPPAAIEARANNAVAAMNNSRRGFGFCVAKGSHSYSVSSKARHWVSSPKSPGTSQTLGTLSEGGRPSEESCSTHPRFSSHGSVTGLHHRSAEMIGRTPTSPAGTHLWPRQLISSAVATVDGIDVEIPEPGIRCDRPLMTNRPGPPENRHRFEFSFGEQRNQYLVHVVHHSPQLEVRYTGGVHLDFGSYDAG